MYCVPQKIPMKTPYGVAFWGLGNKDYTALGFISGFPYCGKLPYIFSGGQAASTCEEGPRQRTGLTLRGRIVTDP